MPDVLHFFALIGEYSLIPIAIFIFSFIPKIRDENAKIVNYGFELVLIEALSHLAVVIRLLSSEKTILNITLALISFLAFLLLGAIFITFLMRYGNLHVSNVRVFYLTFYSAFLGWWLKVFILLYYSHIDVFYGTFFTVLIFLLSREVMNYIIRKYYITWHTLGTQVNDLISQGKNQAAEKIALKILAYTTTNEGYENGDLTGQISLSLAKCYHDGNDRRKIEKGIQLLVNLTENKDYLGDKYMVGMRLASLYIKLNKKEEAINTLNRYLPKQKAEERIKEILEKGNLNSYYNVKN